MTKQAQGAYERYQYSNMYSIYEAYGKPSQAKVRAWHYCMKLKEEKNGRGLKVIGKSCHFFLGRVRVRRGRQKDVHVHNTK